jgi:PIN domain nuclease of toxin-antitoxin system
VKLLLDTHALIWWWADDPRLSAVAKQAIADEANAILVSAASAWEISTKYRIGKLPDAASALSRFNELIVADGFTHLPIEYLHAVRAGGFKENHKDPFDRMLAAQADIENAKLVSIDPAFKLFDTDVLW